MITHLIGSALDPIKKPANIIHIVNNMGRWGSGFVVAISNVSKEPQKMYLNWYDHCRDLGLLLPLGEIQYVKIEDNISVINMVAQHDTQTICKKPPIRYLELRKCLRTVNLLSAANGYTLHMPRIGAVRSGGDWNTIETIIKEEALVENYIYTLPSEKDTWTDCSYANENIKQ